MDMEPEAVAAPKPTNPALKILADLCAQTEGIDSCDSPMAVLKQKDMKTVRAGGPNIGECYFALYLREWGQLIQNL